MMADQNEMLKIVTPMAEDICDHLCRFPKEVSDSEALEDICAECQMGQYVCDILNTYNRVRERTVANESKETLLNPAGKYAAEFAENHGISIAEAMETPMVKARFVFFESTGK
ncbi:hypothetical protein [Lacrimispora indolis]|uniref:hypothetical protein n=1 Tax=Lacrimispora indolis TaxID=69825 RepID=UPI000402F627|nr:hypothetical protein [[Clostridium] methoxybenzovorans]